MAIARLQIEIEEEQLSELDELVKFGDFRTRKDLVNNALTLLKWAVKQKMQGLSIVAMNEEERVYKELEMPFFERVVANSRSKAIGGFRPGLPTPAR